MMSRGSATAEMTPLAEHASPATATRRVQWRDLVAVINSLVSGLYCLPSFVSQVYIINPCFFIPSLGSHCKEKERKKEDRIQAVTSWNLSGQKQAPDPLETPIASKARVYFRLISHLHALEHFHQGNAFKFTSIIAINLKCLIKK